MYVPFVAAAQHLPELCLVNAHQIAPDNHWQTLAENRPFQETFWIENAFLFLPKYVRRNAHETNIGHDGNFITQLLPQ